MKNRLRNTIQRLIDFLRGGQRLRIAAYLAHIEKLVADEDWERASALAKEAAVVAQQAKHPGLVSRIGRMLEQLGEFEAAAPIRFVGERRHYRAQLPIWDGEEIGNRTLLIDQVFDHLGQQLRHARLIRQAARRSGKCIVLAESRLIPLLQRTFSDTVVVDRARKSAVLGQADQMTNYWDLAKWFAKSAASIEAGFVPLEADRGQVEIFSAQYSAQSGRPLVGIAWGTRNKRRQIPALTDWRVLLSGIEATFVSLQYGEVDADIDLLTDSGSVRIFNDRSVDQLADMDRFAAQVASLDFVATIDSTIAHTACALGKRTIVLTDDGPSHWPLRGDRTPWYPTAIIVRRRARAWMDAMAEARLRLERELSLISSRTHQ